MKKFLSMTILLICLSFTACTDSTSTNDSSSQYTVESSSSNPSSAVEKMDWEALVWQLGVLLRTTGWENGTEITPADYALWYGYRVQDLPIVETYRIEGRDRLYFPEEEFEREILNYFDVPIEHLRSEADPYGVYIKEERLYELPTALTPLAEISFEITDVEVHDPIIKIYLSMEFTQSAVFQNMVLTIERTEDGIRYLSYVPQAE